MPNVGFANTASRFLFLYERISVPKIYAIEIKRSNYDLIRLLNKGDDVTTEKKKTYFVFSVFDDGLLIETDTMTRNEMLRKYDISGHSAFVLGLKQA